MLIQISSHLYFDNMKRHGEIYDQLFKGAEKFHEKDPELLKHLDLNEILAKNRILSLGQSLMIVGAYVGVCIDVLYLGGTP